MASTAVQRLYIQTRQYIGAGAVHTATVHVQAAETTVSSSLQTAVNEADQRQRATVNTKQSARQRCRQRHNQLLQ